MNCTCTTVSVSLPGATNTVSKRLLHNKYAVSKGLLILIITLPVAMMVAT